MTDTLYKITLPDGRPCHGGSGAWSLPTDEGPGEWRSVKGRLAPCRNGLHLVPAAQLPRWIVVDTVVWEAEAKGELIDDDDKLVVRTARLTRRVGTLDHRTLVRWAADCAERVLPLFEAKYPTDDRPREAIEAARGWADGTVSARAAAYAANAAATAARAAYAANAAATAARAAYAADAADDAARAAYAADAADDAAQAAYAADDADDATAAYAANAAATAAYAATAADATNAEREWQGHRLLELLEAQG